MKQATRIALALAFGFSAASFSFAQDAHNGHGSQPAAQAPSAMTDGEIRKIDKGAGKMTIKHGPLKNLGMPGMTMAFRVVDPKMLDQVKPGQNIRFEAGKVNGTLMVMKLESAQ